MTTEAESRVADGTALPLTRLSRIPFRELLESARPRQWPKNALVLTPVLAASAWKRPGVASGAAVAFVAFALVSVAVYLVNDVYDARRDRLHPDKCDRPIASGRLPVRWALGGAAFAMTASFGLAVFSDHVELAQVIGVYLVSSLAYSARLKRVPGLELVFVALGFVLRPIAGAEATGIAASGYFLEVCCLAALAVALGKRIAELQRLGDRAVLHRDSLGRYRLRVLRGARRAAAFATTACYVGWAVNRTPGSTRLLAIASAFPLALALWRYSACNDRGQGGAPEDLAFSDRPLQIIGTVWLVLFVAVARG
jgi:decaprenyl-phosphate phosphoribosyltransferase